MHISSTACSNARVNFSFSQLHSGKAFKFLKVHMMIITTHNQKCTHGKSRRERALKGKKLRTRSPDYHRWVAEKRLIVSFGNGIMEQHAFILTSILFLFKLIFLQLVASFRFQFQFLFVSVAFLGGCGHAVSEINSPITFFFQFLPSMRNINHLRKYI